MKLLTSNIVKMRKNYEIKWQNMSNKKFINFVKLNISIKALLKERFMTNYLNGF